MAKGGKSKNFDIEIHDVSAYWRKKAKKPTAVNTTL
jgi:hypothetical protein